MTRDRDALALAERVMAILDEGGFSATYKFALFTAILDLCIEKKVSKDSPPETLTTRQLAEKVIELYWDHVRPYPGVGMLRQGGGRDQQATIIRRIGEARSAWAAAATDTLFRVRQEHQPDYIRLRDEVEWTLIHMPIPRLQKLGQGEDRFLYTYNWTEDIQRSAVSRYQSGRAADFDNLLRLQPGVGDLLVQLNGLLRPLFYREWAVMVARLNMLPEAKLETFLFGSERVSLEPVRRPLRDLQGNRCFYCRDRITGRADVDHFIPWARYPDDGLDNLVVADPKCNNRKRDFLAAAKHVECWMDWLKVNDSDLAAIAASVRWRRDPERTTSIARSIYSRVAPSAPLWVESSTYWI